MNDKSYMTGEVMESFWVARRLAASAIQELGRSRERSGAIDAMRRGVAKVEAAAAALEAGDPTQALKDLVEATHAASEARACTKKPGDSAGPAETGDCSSELVEQTRSAIERVAHRVRNASSRHTTLGAIRTPPAERFP